MEPILEAKKKKSNLAVGSDLYHHDKNEFTTEMFPKIVPLYDGQELNINQKIIRNGLGTISIRNLRSKKCSIKKRNSFFDLHRPELKGLNIVPAENQQEKMLQQYILKEVKTIYEMKSISHCKMNGPQSLSPINQVNNLEKNKKAEAELLTVKRFIQLLEPLETTAFVRQGKLLDTRDAELETSVQQIDKLCAHDEEIKSTVIG